MYNDNWIKKLHLRLIQKIYSKVRFFLCKIQCSHNKMRVHGKLKNTKNTREHLISLRVQKVINIRFLQSHVSIVNLVNWREVAYASSVISRCWNGVGFPLPEFFSSRQSPAISNGKNAKFARRATTFWLEYSTEEKENRKRTAKVWETLASIPSNERQPHSVNPTTEIFYFLVPSYARFKETEGDCRELMGKMEQKRAQSRCSESLWFALSVRELWG